MKNSFDAFTLAEVLITLVVVGVVAAITLPSFIGKIQDRQYVGARQKALASIGEAGRILAINDELTTSTSAEDFVKNHLSKKLSISKMCDMNHYEDCGLSPKIKKADGKTEVNMPTKMKGELSPIFDYGSEKLLEAADLNSYGFMTANGYSVNLFYYSGCIADNKNVKSVWGAYRIQEHLCFAALYDMNDKKGPNTVGKDIGLVGLFYPDTLRIIAVLPAQYDWSSTMGGNPEYRTYQQAVVACDSFGNDYRLPDKDETALMAMAGNLIGARPAAYMTSSLAYNSGVWYQTFDSGSRGIRPLGSGRYVRCIKK